MSILVIARLTFQEAARRRILLAALVLGLLFLLVYGVGFSFIIQEIRREEGGNPNPLALREFSSFLMLAGLYVVSFLTTMMTVLTSVDTLSGEIATGTIQTLLSKPVQRWEIVLGKWLGFAGMLTLYLLLMAGGVMLVAYGIGDYAAPHAWRGLGLMWLNALMLLGLSLAGGAVLSTLANGVLVFGMYGVAFVGGWIEQIGSMLENETAINIGVLSSLLLPSEAMWRRAAYELQSPLVNAIGVTPFTSLSTPSPIMIGYGALYALIALLLAQYLFAQRDM